MSNLSERSTYRTYYIYFPAYSLVTLNPFFSCPFLGSLSRSLVHWGCSTNIGCSRPALWPIILCVCAGRPHLSPVQDFQRLLPAREREMETWWLFLLPYGFYFLISFSVGERDPPFSKEYQEKSTNRRRTPFFSPEKPWPVVFHPSGTAANRPRESDQPDKKNKKENQNSPGRNPGQLFFVYIKERGRRGVVG